MLSTKLIRRAAKTSEEQIAEVIDCILSEMVERGRTVRSTVYRWLADQPIFRARVDAASEAIADHLVSKAQAGRRQFEARDRQHRPDQAGAPVLGGRKEGTPEVQRAPAPGEPRQGRRPDPSRQQRIRSSGVSLDASSGDWLA